ncbi:5-formyltetrahydrofolate cyclo-ligase [Chloroflexales bacterium ZM16-3]|nr:5-formyltetrahydrofolate cyclo-ligase [Chloroflexales bacterium ZM16-3]
MDDNCKEQKRLLRPRLMGQRDQIAGREDRSAAIREQIISQSAFQRARAIHCYLSIRSEVDTRLLIAAALDEGKAVAVPVIGPDRRMIHSWIRDIDPADFVEGVLGTLSPRIIRPALPGDWDLTIVPLLGFDREGHRIGYGKGYYDRLLAVTPAFAIGVAFAAQEVANLPHEAHDMCLDAIVTENEIIALRALPV